VGVRVDGLHQVAQRADDLDASVAFYRDVLGLPFLARFDPPGLAFFDLGGSRLLLEHAAPSALLYLHVPDVDAAHEALMAAGVEFESPPHTIFMDDQGQFGPAGEEERMAFFRDPAGNLIAIAGRR
jgi:methylmalonyl-CoA/ethylmalonyl-CoA epimerase